MTISMNKVFDPLDPLLRSDPYGLFKQYSAKGPVQRGKSSVPGYDHTWYFFGFEEAREILRSPLQEPQHRTETEIDTENSGNKLSEERAIIWRHLAQWPLFQSPPLHTARRALLSNAFREPALALLGSDIQATADDLLDRALSKDSIELQSEFAYPLAVTTITRLIGLPIPDIAWFKGVTRRLSNVLDLGYTPDAYVSGLAALSELIVYVEDTVKYKRDHPADDLISYLICKVDDDATLDNPTIISLITQLLFAGQETVADGIGNGVHALSANPEQLRILQKDPGLVDNAVREVMRYNCPVLFTGSRMVTEDIQFGDVKIRQGEPVIVNIGACNHDERRFQHPEVFDIQRDLSGSEISFGYGIHYCLGVHLARLVNRVALQKLLQRMPEQWILTSQPKWRSNTVFRGPTALTLSL